MELKQEIANIRNENVIVDSLYFFNRKVKHERTFKLSVSTITAG